MGKTSWQIKDVLLRDRYSFLVQMEGSDRDPEDGGVRGGTRSVWRRELILSLTPQGKLPDLHLK